jgi:hypothetical protein
VGRPTGDSGRAGGELTPERSEILEPRQGRGVAAPALLLVPYSPKCVEVEFSEVRASKESRFLLERAQEGFSHKKSLGQRVVETHLPALHKKSRSVTRDCAFMRRNARYVAYKGYQLFETRLLSGSVRCYKYQRAHGVLTRELSEGGKEYDRT